MRATQFDPRLMGSITDASAYGVTFWTKKSPPTDGVEVAPEADEWLVTQADIDTVLAWARSHAQGRHLEVIALCPDPMGYSGVRLLGSDLSEVD